SVFFFSSRRRHTRFSRDWSSDVCSSDLDVERARGLCHLVSSPRALAKPVRRAALARGRPREGPPQHGRGCRGDEALDHPPPADGLLALATGGRRLVVVCVALVDHRDQPPLELVVLCLMMRLSLIIGGPSTVSTS